MRTHTGYCKSPTWQLQGGSNNYATQLKHTHLAYTPDNCFTQNTLKLRNWSLKKERKRTIKRKKQSSLLTSPLANVSLGGGSLIQQHHPHGDCCIWDKVVKETTHSHTGGGEAGSTHCPRKSCWTHICTYRHAHTHTCAQRHSSRLARTSVTCAITAQRIYTMCGHNKMNTCTI